MKYFFFITFILLTSFSFSQDTQWVKTDAEITEITIHQSKRVRETAIIKFLLEDGNEQLSNVELFRIPFIGSMKSVGDKITIHYNPNNPVLAETILRSFITKYGMYILIFLGIIFSIKPLLNYNKSINS